MPAKKTLAKKPSGKSVAKSKPVVKAKKAKPEKQPVKIELNVETGKTKTTSKPVKTKPHWEEQKLEPQFQGPAPETLSPEAKTDLLLEWSGMSTKVAELKPFLEQERALRKRAFDAFFVQPKEGTQYAELAQGWRLRTNYQIDRSFDRAAMNHVFPQLVPPGQFNSQEEYNAAFAALTAGLINWEPKLNMEAFRQLSEANQKILDQCLVTKPKSVTLELVPPNEAEGA